jgi:hypothetical protein
MSPSCSRPVVRVPVPAHIKSRRSVSQPCCRAKSPILEPSRHARFSPNFCTFNLVLAAPSSPLPRPLDGSLGRTLRRIAGHFPSPSTSSRPSRFSNRTVRCCPRCLARSLALSFPRPFSRPFARRVPRSTRSSLPSRKAGHMARRDPGRSVRRLPFHSSRSLPHRTPSHKPPSRTARRFNCHMSSNAAAGLRPPLLAVCCLPYPVHRPPRPVCSLPAPLCQHHLLLQPLARSLQRHEIDAA